MNDPVATGDPEGTPAPTELLPVPPATEPPAAEVVAPEPIADVPAPEPIADVPAPEPIADVPEPIADVPAPAPRETLFASAFLRLVLIGASLGVATFLQLSTIRVALVTTNVIAHEERNRLLVYLIAGAGIFGLFGLIFLILARKGPALRRLHVVSRVLAPLQLAFLLPLFFDWQVFQSQELIFVVTAALFGLALERTLRTSFEAMPWPGVERLTSRVTQRFPKLVRRFPYVLVGLAVAAFCVYFSYFTVLQHYRLMTYSWDMAIFDNMMWNLLRGHWFKAAPDLGRTGSHIQYHATFGAYFFAPFYALYQHPQTLLILQATLAGLGALPLFLLAKLNLKSVWAGVALVYAYLIHAPLHSPIFYDFHFFTTAPFWIGWVLYFFETGRKKGLVLVWIMAILIREELSAGLSMAALLYLLSGRRARWALIGGILSATYFVCMKFVIMPLHRTAGADKQTFSWMFYALVPPGESGFNGVVRTLISNPVFTLGSLLDSDKLAYLLRIMGPVLLLPLRHKRTWMLFIPGTLFTMLSTGYKPLIETFFQYTSNYTPYIFFASALSIASLRVDPVRDRFKVSAALWAVVITATVYSYNYGAIFQRNTFRAGFHKVEFVASESEKLRHRQLYELIAMIPPRASVAATEMEAAHVSARPDCFTMRFSYDNADYLLLNLDETSWGESRAQAVKAINSGRYGFVASRGRFGLWRRGPGTDKDEEGERLLGISSGRPRHHH